MTDTEEEVIDDQNEAQTEPGAARSVTFDDVPDAENKTEQEIANFRELRQRYRDQGKRLRSLERELESARPKPQDAGPRPTMESVGFDENKLADAIIEWDAKRRKIEEQSTVAQRQQKEQDEAWQNTVQFYSKSRAEVAAEVEDFEDIEDDVKSVLGETRFAILMDGAKNPADMVLGLGKSPKLLSELAKNTNNIKFATALGALEAKMKVAGRGTAPPPDRAIRASGGSDASSPHLKKLEEAAQRTGNWTEVFAYKRELKRKEAAKNA